MDFSLSEEQRMIQETARQLFQKECSMAFIRKAWNDRPLASSLWDKHLCDWVELAQGDMSDMVLFMEEHGRALAPGPFFATLTAHLLAHHAHIELHAGKATVAVSDERGLWVPHAHGTKHFVPNADEAEHIVVIAGSDQSPQLTVLRADQAKRQEVDNMDRLRPVFSVTPESSVSPIAIAPEVFQRIKQAVMLVSAAELIGVGRNLLDSAVAYAKERQQFGRAIGSFQGLQWKLVNMTIELETAAAAVSYAAMLFDANHADTAKAVLSAKAEAGQAARHCARTGLQVHGGIGYTFEHGLHYALRRAYAGDAFMGNHEYQFQQLGELLFQA